MKQTLIMFLACAVIPAPAAAEFSFTLASSYDRESPLNDALQGLANNIQEASGGEIDLDYFCCRNLTGSGDPAIQTQQGIIDIAAFPLSLLAVHLDSLSAFSLPFMFQDRRDVVTTLISEFSNDFSQMSLVLVAATALGPATIVVTDWESVKGNGLAGLTIAGESLAALPVLTETDSPRIRTWELSGAIAAGQIAAGEIDGFEYFTHWSLPSITSVDNTGAIFESGHRFDVGVVVMGMEAFLQLGDEEREVVLDVGREWSEEMITISEGVQNDAISKLASNGIPIRNWNDVNGGKPKGCTPGCDKSEAPGGAVSACPKSEVLAAKIDCCDKGGACPK